MHLRNLFLVIMTTLVVVSTSLVSADNQSINESINEQIPIDNIPVIEKIPDGFFVDAPLNPDMQVMIVRVVNQQNEVVISVRSEGESVELFAEDLPDGEYRYQVKTIIPLDTPIGTGADYEADDILIDSGSFTIKNNELLNHTDMGLEQNASRINVVSNFLVSLIGKTLDLVTSPAYADLTAANLIEPAVFFDKLYIDDVDPGPEWKIHAKDSYFRITDIKNNRQAVSIDSAGDISWAGSSMFLDRSSQELSLGTTLTPADFTIYGSIPDIRLHSEGDTSEAEIELNSGDFRIWTRPTDSDGWTQPFHIDTNAPNDSFGVLSDGDISVGSGFYFNLVASDPTLHIGNNTSSAYSLKISTVNTPDIFLQNVGSSGVQMNMLTNEFALDMDTDGDGVRDTSNVFTINKGAPAHSFKIDENGDIFVGPGFQIDSNLSGSGLGAIKIGKGLHAESELQLYGNTATLQLVSDSPLKSWTKLRTNQSSFFIDMAYQEGGILNVVDNIFSISNRAPPLSVAIDAAGNMGMGTFSPAASIHVQRDDSSARILVEETNASAGPRTLFQLKNNGNTKFGVLNTQAGVEWAFANPGTGFRLSRQGSGIVEMEIFNNGNMNIAGALTQNSDINAKTAISDIDSHEILELVGQLPVSKWEYKDARGEAHIGPMAQDFYAAFGLGATETGISTIDTAGVALAAIKALHAENKSLQEQNAGLQKRLEALEQNTVSQVRLEDLEQQQTEMRLMISTLLEARQLPAVVMKTTMN